MNASPKPALRRALQALGAAALLAVYCAGHAESLAAQGCPMYHCTPQATGIMTQAVIPTVLTSNSNGSLGSQVGQGCSGNGTRLACLYLRDTAPANRKGTLKMLNATTLKTSWGSASAPDSYDLDAATAAYGQVPVLFADGSLAAGDGFFYVRYDSSGAMTGQLPVAGSGKDYGLTPIGPTYGVVSQGDGVLTLVDLATWQSAGSLTLTDPATGAPVILIVPSAGSTGAVYAVGYDSVNGNGFLYSVVLNARTHQLSVRSVFTFTGKSGASPVVVTPQMSGLANNLLLLHVPGLIGDAQPLNRLLALADAPAGLVESWQIPLATAMTVSPTVDQASQSLFYQDGATPLLHQSGLISGGALATFDLQAIGGFPSSFILNGHVGASQAGGVLTLLLAGAYSEPPAGAQYIMAFQPIESPAAYLWTAQIGAAPAAYTAAWNLAPATEAGAACPVAIAVAATNLSTLVRVCDH